MSTSDASADGFTDIHLTDIDFKNGHSSAAPNAGPWTHSTNSYSRKVHHTNSVARQKLKFGGKKHFVGFIACAIVFLVGLGLGIVIGHFAIGKNSSEPTNNSGKSGASSGQQTGGSGTIIPPVTSLPPCNCPPAGDVNNVTTAQPPVDITTSYQSQCFECSRRIADQTMGDEDSKSPFAPLTMAEMQKVTNALLARNLTSQSRSIKFNRLSHMYTYLPNKSLVLDYLDNNGLFPGRFAKVHVVRGARDPPDVMEYKVGPLNETEPNLTIEELRLDGELSFNQRPLDPADFSNFYGLLKPHLQAIRDMLSESFDGANKLQTNFSPLPTTNTSDRLSHMYLYRSGMGAITLSIVPVTCLVHHPGKDTNDWWVSDFFYLNQGPFSSGQELNQAYNNGSLRRIAYPYDFWYDNRNDNKLQFNTSLPPRPLSDIPPPKTYEPQGPRYTIRGHRISWMGWEFEFSSSPIQGPQIFDVRFKGERIAYEISLQDITLLYSSPSNGAGPPAISDTVYQLGTYNSPRFGVDCPDRSSVLEVSKLFYTSKKVSKAACLFEADGQQSLWRHTYKGLADHYLVIRAAMNLGNYDYTAEWKFHLDGTLDTGLTASGYLYGAFWDPENPLVDGDKSFSPLGYRISDYLLGPIHDHAMVFKVDLDILGTENSFETVHWRAGTTLEAFQASSNLTTEKPSFAHFNYSRYLEHELLENEAGFVNNPLKPKYFTVVNENEKNMWGMRRGYRLLSHSTVAENLQDHLMFQPWEHLKHQVSVTRRKDDELYGTVSWYGLQQPTIAENGLGSMLNNEPTRNTDLVLWVVEKFLHAPTSEDMPITLNVHNGFTLKPYNYFDRSPVFDLQAHYGPDPYTPEPCVEPIFEQR